MVLRDPLRQQRTAILIGLFLLSRALFYAIGIRFDASPLFTFWQFLDVPLLEHRLAESLWYLHCQPPLYNLFLGLVLKLSDVHTPALAHAIYIVIGIGQLLLIDALLRRFGFRERSAAIVALFFVISPSSIVFENWLFYDYPLALFLLTMTMGLWLFFERREVRYSLLFFGAMLCVVLTRSLFHVTWVIAITLLLVYLAGESRGKLLRGAAIPLVLIGLFYAKDLTQFGSLTGSTWFGQHLARVTTAELDEPIRKDLVAKGILTRTALIPAFSPLSYYDTIALDRHTTGIAALDEVSKISGFENFNNREYIEISNLYRHDAIYIASHYPNVLFTSIAKSCFFYLRAPEEFYMLRSQTAKLGFYEPMYRALIYGEFDEYPDHTTKGQPGYQAQMLRATPWLMLLFMPAMLLWALYTIAQFIRTRSALRGTSASSHDVTLLFLSVTLLFVSVVCNIFEMGENNRIRYMMDPLFLLFGSVLVRRVYLRMTSAKHSTISHREHPARVMQVSQVEML